MDTWLRNLCAHTVDGHTRTVPRQNLEQLVHFRAVVIQFRAGPHVLFLATVRDLNLRGVEFLLQFVGIAPVGERDDSGRVMYCHYLFPMVENQNQDHYLRQVVDLSRLLLL